MFAVDEDRHSTANLVRLSRLEPGLMVENFISEAHRRRNQSTKSFRSAMSEHRQRLMELLRNDNGSPGGHLALLGAGNANDVDLSELVNHYDSVTLIDLDEDALRLAFKELSLEQRTKVTCLGGVDVTGIFASLASADTSSRDGVRSIIRQTMSARLPSNKRFDVVASTCLISQLIDSINMVMPAQHPLYLELVLAVRNRHIEQIAELLVSGGKGVLISDFVASETAPELATLKTSQLLAAAQNWIRQNNFFTGCNPNAIHQFLADSSKRLEIVGVTMKGPWRWDIGTKMFAVFAAVFDKREGSSSKRRSQPTI